MSEYLKKINTAAALVNALGVVGAKVRELENKAPDMTSYSMFTQMNNVVNYQAEQIHQLQKQLEQYKGKSVNEIKAEGIREAVNELRFLYVHDSWCYARKQLNDMAEKLEVRAN